MGIRELGFSDEHFASEIGGLYRQKLITEAEYNAGVTYGEIILNYLKTIDAPLPYSNGRCQEFADEVCLSRKLRMAETREILKRTGKNALRVVDRVAVYGEQISLEELPLLRAGLRALSGAWPNRDAAAG